MTTAIPIKDGAAAAEQLVAETGPSGFWPWSQPVARGAPVSDANPLPINAPSPLRVSGPIVTPQPPGVAVIQAAGSSQPLFAAGAVVNGFWVQNPTSATESLYVCMTGSANPSAPGSIELAPGMLYESPFPVTTAISIYGGTTGHAFTANVY